MRAGVELTFLQRQEFIAPSGATSSQYAALDGAFSFYELVFYNYDAPKALRIHVSSVFNLWLRYSCPPTISITPPAETISPVIIVAFLQNSAQIRFMKIVSFKQPLPVSDPESFLDLTAETPQPAPRDLLVEIRAISVNPVDAKIRSGGGPGRPDGQLQILGWDAAGVVTAIGSQVTQFKPGDEVYYAGDVGRPCRAAQFPANQIRPAAVRMCRSKKSPPE